MTNTVEMNRNTVTVVNSKPETQKQIRALRQAGLEVVKDSCGAYSADHVSYETKNGVRTGNTKMVRIFTAIPGARGYLIRRAADLFGA